jgi:hypothetical protein
MRITLTVSAALKSLLEEGAKRDKRSLSNHSYRLLSKAAREEALSAMRVEQGEQRQEAAA